MRKNQNTERYRVSLRIQSECGKIRTKIIPNVDTFHAVYKARIFRHRKCSCLKQICNPENIELLLDDKISCAEKTFKSTQQKKSHIKNL